MYLHETTNPVWGQTNHPETKTRGPGGSSGGDAALVAAGVVSLGVGNDLAGSVRQPAHACGVPSLLPSSGILGKGGAFNSMPNFGVISSRTGFLASNVADLKLVADSLELVTNREEPFRAKKIAVWEDAGIIEPSPAIKRAVREASQALVQAGHHVECVQDEVAQEAAWVMFGLLSADGGRDIQNLFNDDKPIPGIAKLLRIGSLPRWIRPFLSAFMRIIGNRIDAAALKATGPRSPKGFKELLARREQIVKHMQNTAEEFDAIICPVSSLPALQHGTAARLVAAASPCLLANLVDLTAGVVPVTRVRGDEQSGRAFSFDRVLRTAIQTDIDSIGLPVGVQVIGLNGDPAERTVLDLMAAIESRVNFSRWAHQ
jgi:fatty acid amide hydrolase